MVGTWAGWRSWVRWTVGLVGIVAVGTVVAQETQQRPTFRGGARFVRVDVFPTDRAGRPVEGLTKDDFEVYEDGTRQEIDTFEFVDIVADPEEARLDPNTQREGEELAKDPRARLFVIVLDTKHVEALGGARIRRPLIDMLDRLIGPRDLFGVITPQLRSSDLILGRKTMTVGDMLQRYWAWGVGDSKLTHGPAEAFLEECFGAGARAQAPLGELMLRFRERETLEHLDALVAKLAAIRDEKKAVVIVTQGWRQFTPNERETKRLEAAVPDVYMGGGRITTRNPNSPSSGRTTSLSDCYAQATALLMADNRQFFRELLRKAQAANVSFYPVDPRGLAVFDTPLSQGGPVSVIDDFAALRRKQDGLMELAENTDGMALMNSNDLALTLRRFADSLSRFYLLGYYSTNTKFDGGYRRLDVKVRQPDIRLKARRGYYAPTQAEIDAIAAGHATADAPVGAETLALSAALERLAEVRHDRDLFIQASRVPGGLMVSAELGVNARQAPAWAKGGEVRLLISAGAGQIAEVRPIEPLRSGIILRVPLPDAGEARIDARARSGAGGAADATAVVAAGGGGLLGDVMSYRGLARALMPAADGRYRRTERATIEAPLAEGAVPAGARVLDRQGNPLNVPTTSSERVDEHGTRWMSVALSLAPLTEGDYIVEIEAAKGDGRERRLFAIRVVR
jgi:VWFA-related protein